MMEQTRPEVPAIPPGQTEGGCRLNLSFIPKTTLVCIEKKPWRR